MKQLGTGSDGVSWNAALVVQLSFIRKHLRFPVSRRLFPSFLGILSLLPLGFLGLYMVFFKSHNSSHSPYWILPVLGLPVVVGLVRYFRSLRFIAVPAYPLQADNMRLVEAFFRTYGFAHGRHPQAPEVFQMLSRNVGNRQNELREVLLFIADPGRILLNSHFVGDTFGMPVSSGHSRRMARMLKQFLNAQQSAGNSTELCHPR